MDRIDTVRSAISTALLAVAPAALLGCPSAALGQGAPPLAGGDDLHEIVVTAQKRTQELSEVPISITVVTGEQLERSGVSRVEDLYAIAPSLSFNPAQSSSGAGLRIRGVGSAGFNSATEPSVSTVIDGMVTGPGGAALVDLFDVERVEVLRGPQGTLFGKNSSAGVVSVVSRAPTRDTGGYLNVRYGENVDEIRVEGAMGGGVGETGAVRIAGYTLSQGEGEIYNPARKTTENTRDRWGVRLRGDVEIAGTTVQLIGQYEEQHNRCCRTSFYGLDPVAYGALTRLYLLPRQAANGVVPGPDNRLSIADGPLGENTATTQLVANVSRTLSNGLTVRSITGYRRWREKDAIDVDGVDVNVGNDSVQARNLRVISEELQLLSPDTGALRWVLGAYAYTHRLESDTITAGGGGTILGQSSTLGLGTTDTDNYALFADGTYDLNPRWQAFAGVRALHEKIHAWSYRSGNYFAFPRGTFSGAVEADDTNWVGRAGLRFSPNDRHSYYVSVSRGYKGRAIDTNTSNLLFSNPARAVLDPETVVAFELGARTAWLDDRVALNATLFRSDFRNFQASSFDNVTSSQILRNAGKLRSQGFEADFSVRPWSGASLSGGVAFVDAVYEDYRGAPCTVVQNALRTCPAAGQDLSGKRLNNNPRWQYSVRAQQDVRTTGTVGGYVRAEYNWRDDVIYGGDLNAATTQPAFGIANLRAGVTFANGRYEVAAFVENVFDESYALRIYDSPGFTGSYSAFFGPRRTAGAELRARF